MILRSQLRMNKNIVFPFISCIMIMFTLLVLIHKSADELNAAKKENIHCKQQQESLNSQFQNAIELKLRLERSLENEKTSAKQKIEELQTALNQEKEERRKEKEEADRRYETLNQRINTLQSENNENVDALNKKILDLEEDKSKLDNNIMALHADNKRKDMVIKELQDKLKSYENSIVLNKKVTSESNAAVPGIPDRINVGGIQSPSKGPVTPQINPMAVVDQDDSPKQGISSPNVDRPENSMQNEMRKKLSPEKEVKLPPENVVKAPQAQSEAEKNKVSEDRGDIGVGDNNNGKNMLPNFLPPPLNYAAQDFKQASSVSNNAAENVNRDEQQEVLPPPAQNAGAAFPPDEKKKVNEIPRNMKNDYRVDFDKDDGLDEGGEYEENEVGDRRKAGDKNPNEVIAQ